MPRSLFPPVSVRRRSAAQGRANAHPHPRSARGGRDERGAITSTSVSGKFGGLQGFTEQIKGCEISLFHTFSTPGNSPVKWG